MSSMRPFAVLLAACALSACAPNDPYQNVGAQLSEKVLLPNYNAWASADQTLASSAKAFCAGEQDLAQARQHFSHAQAAWATLQPMLIGPLSEGNSAWQVQFWPDKKNLVARQVTALLKNKPQLSVADLEKSSVVVQGLSAYEYVLYDETIDLTQAEQKARYCPLLIAVGEHQQNLSQKTLQQWQAKDGTAQQLQSFPNDHYADAQEAIADVLRVQISAIDGLKKKLGAPLGRQSKGVPQPYQAEAWRSQASLNNLAAALNGAEQLWQNGVRSLLSNEHTALAERIDSAYQHTQGLLAEQSQTLTQLLASADGRQQMDELYSSLDTLHRLQEADLAKALGITLGFNAHDGD